MPTFAELSGYWPKERHPGIFGTRHRCRHTCASSFPNDEALACKHAMLKGPHPWQRPHVREKLPPPYKLPYLGNWKPGDVADYWARSPIHSTMRRAYVAMNALDRSAYLDTITTSAGSFGRPSATLRRHCA